MKWFWKTWFPRSCSTLRQTTKWWCKVKEHFWDATTSCGRWRRMFVFWILSCQHLSWRRGGARWSSSFIWKVVSFDDAGTQGFLMLYRTLWNGLAILISKTNPEPYLFNLLGPAVERELCLGKDLRNIISTKISFKSAIFFMHWYSNGGEWYATATVGMGREKGTLSTSQKLEFTRIS